jgi:L-ascorbate metabolism protein UlaG (beta-lactamase superfamily)
VQATPNTLSGVTEKAGEQQEKPKENKGFFYWLRSTWDKIMHDGRETQQSIKVKVKRIRKNLSRRELRAFDRTMSGSEAVHGVAPTVVTRHHDEVHDPIEYELAEEGKAKPKKHRLRNMVEAGKLMRQRRKEVVELERKQQDFPFFRYFIGGQKSEIPRYTPNWRDWRNDEITAAWIGHATVLINFYGTWILTDPVFSERTGYDLGLFVVGPKRLVKPALLPNDLPKLDLLLLSHAHMDHTDMPSLKQLRNARRLYCPRNTADIFKKLGILDLQELDWGDRVKLDDRNVVVEAIEVKHFGWRYPWEPCRGRSEEGGRSFNAFMIEGEDPNGRLRSVVFAGDTAYTESFRKLGDRLRSEGREVDLAIMPIGAYEPWIGAHCNPEQAWQMTQEMNAQTILPIHWNTFIQSAEPRFEPIEWLHSEVDDDSQIALSEIGATWRTK